MGASIGTGTSAGPGPIQIPRSKPSHIYQSSYGNQGLGATPQAMQYQMPTFNRPQAPPPQAQYSVPYGNLQRRQPKILGMPIGALFTPQQTSNLANNTRMGLNFAQYQMMMANPRLFKPFVEKVQQGQEPETLGYERPPAIPYMTEAQAKAYNQRQALGLSRLLGPAPADPSASDGGG